MNKYNSRCCNKNDIRKASKLNASDRGSFFTTLLLILAPKCPYCILAYSSSLLLFLDIDNVSLIPFLNHIKPFLAIITVLIIYYNYKGQKTIVSLAIASFSLLLLLISTYTSTFIIKDWVIYSMLFFSVWYNSNFLSLKNFLLENFYNSSKNIR